MSTDIIIGGVNHSLFDQAGKQINVLNWHETGLEFHPGDGHNKARDPNIPIEVCVWHWTGGEGEPDPEGQKRLAAKLQRIFVADAPAIPLYPNPSWAEFNTGRFDGFPTADDPYADPSPNKFDRGEVLLVLTRLTPREAVGTPQP